MNPKIRNSLTAMSKKNAAHYEQNNKPSMTIPNQSMGVDEILRRYASGLSMGAMKVPVYHGDDDLWHGIDPKSLDLVEVQQIIHERREQMQSLKDKAANDVAERRKKAEEFRAKEIQRQVAEQVGNERSTYEKLRNKYEKLND